MYGYFKAYNTSSIYPGCKIVIVSSDESVALSTNPLTYNRGQADVEKVDYFIDFSSTDPVQIITLDEGVEEGTFAFRVDNGYLYAAGSNSGNYLKTKDSTPQDKSQLLILKYRLNAFQVYLKQCTF